MSIKKNHLIQGKTILLEMIGVWKMMDLHTLHTIEEEDFQHLLQCGKVHKSSSLNPFLVIVLSVMGMDIESLNANTM